MIRVEFIIEMEVLKFICSLTCSMLLLIQLSNMHAFGFENYCPAITFSLYCWKYLTHSQIWSSVQHLDSENIKYSICQDLLHSPLWHFFPYYDPCICNYLFDYHQCIPASLSLKIKRCIFYLLLFPFLRVSSTWFGWRCNGKFVLSLHCTIFNHPATCFYADLPYRLYIETLLKVYRL